MKRTELCGIEYVDVNGVRWWNAHESKPPTCAEVILAGSDGRSISGGFYAENFFWNHAGFHLYPDWWATVEVPAVEPRRKNED